MEQNVKYIKNNMKKLKILLTIILIIPISLFCQEKKKEEKTTKTDSYSGATTWSNNIVKGSVSGKIKDYSNKNPLPYASISIVNKKTNQIIEGTITSEKGNFLMSEIEIGEYILKISSIGYEAKEIIFTTTKKQPNYYNNDITLNLDNKLLSEINIEDQKTIYESKIDKIVYNAENDLNETENDAIDVLRKTPLLTVDLEGNVSLRGSRNIKFLINGKASTFFSGDISTALSMIPADQIKSIEVITSPGAKYDGDGDAGIINIITKQKKIDGYQATIKGGIGSKATNSGLNVNFGKEKWGFSINGGSWGSGFSSREGFDYFKRLDWNNGDTNILIREGTSLSSYNGYRGAINSFYNITPYTSINSSFNMSGRSKPYQLDEEIFQTIFSEDTDTSNSSINKTDRTLKLEWTTDYIKKFQNNEDRELSIAFQIGGNINDGNTSIFDLDQEILFNQNDEKVIEETIQIDYTHPFGKKELSTSNNSEDNNKNKRNQKWNKNSSKLSGSNKIEIGGKVINRDREIIYSDLENNIYTLSEEFNYNQLVASSYISSEFNLPKDFGLKTGLRLEHTKTSGNWLNNTQSPFEKKYNNLLPSLTFSKSFSPLRSVKISYNQRIRRPSVRQINTNIDRSNNSSISIGNPNLKPTLTENFEIGINSFGRFLQGSFQIYHKHSKNVIESFLEVNDNGISESQYKNIGETKQTGIGFFGSINFGSKFSFRSGMNIYNYTGKDARIGYSDWTEPVLLYSYNFGGNLSFAKYWKAETFAFYRSPSQTLQGSITSFSMMSIGIKREFKNKRGSIGIRIIEPFQKNKEFRSDLTGDFFTQESIRTIPFRSLSISFKYTLGKLNFKDGYKKTNIRNDDIKEESQDY
ncbi:MAG: hypothetical protein CMD15_03015 [Flavobacteriales bacterium]|nr:hypothetical protein [Flavobacteriales bacterium]